MITRSDRARISALRPQARPSAIPLSFAQQRLWFLQRLEPESGAYIIPLATRLTGPLAVEHLERALEEIVRRHETLRTTFEDRDGTVTQVIHPPADSFTLPIEDLSHLDAGAREREVEARVSEEEQRLFDLSAGPLFRARLLRLASQEHVLLLTMHHTVGDVWSIGVLGRELSSLYDAFRLGRPSPLPPLPLQQADYAIWQREHLTGEVLDEQVAYWRARLAGAPALLALPTDHPRPAVQSDRGAGCRVVLSREILHGLRALARREGVTLYMALLAAFQTLLGRYSGQTDIVVGSPIAGRTHEELEGLIGFFVNSLAMRADLSGDPSFRSLLTQVRDTALGAYAHQSMPFERLVEELAPERSLAYSPIFQVMFALQNVPGHSSIELAGLEARPPLARDDDAARYDPVRHDFERAGERANQTSKYDVMLQAAERPDGLHLLLIYRTDLFEAPTMTRLLAHFECVLAQVIAAPERRLSELTLLEASERQHVIVECNATAADIPRDRLLHELFETLAARTPDAIAVDAGDQQITYDALEAGANRIAHHLRRHAVGPEVCVGVCLERGPQLLEALLGVLKAGGAYLPLDPAYPPQRLAGMVQTSGAALILTSSHLRASLSGAARTSVCLDLIADELAAEPAHPASSSATAGNLAYVIFTSGSTGRPKGVLGTHGQVTHYLASVIDSYGLRGDASVLQIPTMAVDACLREMFGAFGVGARLVLLPSSGASDPRVLLEHLVTRQVQGIWAIVPSFLHVLLDTAAERHVVCPALRTLLVAGEAFPAALAARARAAFPHARVINQYGPTEATITATYVEATPEADRDGVLRLGRPLPNVRVYVLDASLQPAPMGVAGEAYLGGAGITRGYAAQPGATADRFVPDAVSGERGQRLYRTGDRVRWIAGRQLEFLGRLDDQIKLRGFRIEPGEVEAAIRSAPGVSQAAVVLREHRGEPRLIAYVGGDAAPSFSVRNLRAHLEARLPVHMIPSAFVVVDALPLLPNGKLDRKRLPAPEYVDDAEYVAPRTPTEELLTGIWLDVLPVDRVGVHENFFALGGHSLMATRVVSRIRERLGVELPVQAIFEAPRIAELATRVDEARQPDAANGASGTASALPLLGAIERPARIPLSFAQQRLWFVDQLEPGKSTYNIGRALRLTGILDADALTRALGEIVRRHETLRTTFEERQGVAAQVIHPPPRDFTLPTEDLTHLDRDEQERIVAAREDEEGQTPFDLSAGPLFRAKLLRLSSEAHVLLVTTHHIVSDDWSLGVLTGELSTLYGAYVRGEASPLAPLRVQYADYALWQRATLTGERLERQIAYWRRRLAGAPALLELPTDRPRPAVQSDRGARQNAVLPPPLLSGLRALAQREGVTTYMALLAAFQVLLGKYSDQTDVVVGSTIAGRTHEELEPLIGFVVNTLVLRTDLSGDPTFLDLLAQVRETTLGAYAHQALPYERLVEEVVSERSLAYSPLFQVLMVLHNAPRETDARVAGLDVQPLPPRTNHTSKYDLVLHAAEKTDGLHLVLAYRTDLFEAPTIARLLGHYQRLLEQASAAPQRRLSDMELLDAPERRQVLVDWNATAADIPRDRCLHELFEAQAARAPDAVAVVAGDAQFTYHVLEARANQLAHDLRGHGVGPEVRVGVCLERGPECLIALLGVLKAGGAYVPLDPAFPQGRLIDILESSEAALVLTASDVRAAVPDTARDVVCLDVIADRLADQSVERPEAKTRAGMLAYVVYTSGSTGRPKGVLGTHGLAAHYVGAIVESYGLRGCDSVLQVAGTAVDACLREIFGAWSVGARLVLLPAAAAADPRVLLDHLLTRNIGGVWSIVPSFLQVVVHAAGERGIRCPAVRTLLVVGEAFPRALAEQARSVFPRARIINQYGPTEGTMTSTYADVPPHAGRDGIVPLGRPLPNVRVYVLDASLRPMPAGLAGQAYLAGAGVTRGYAQQAALTAERFVPDPFSGAPGARLYRTGDRVRWRDDGTLEFLGRMDGQIKLRGLRVEPAEIEAVLRECPGVGGAAVMVREDAGEKRLVGYVTPAADSVPSDTALRAWLRARLPDYMVPSAFVPLDAFPLLPNGKLDRAALPAPVYDGEAVDAPRTLTEELLAGIWTDLLPVERVGIHDDFFSIGGHSLLATMVESRVGEVFGIELELGALFEGPTIAELADRVDQLRSAAAGPPEPIERAARSATTPMPLSFAQQRLWFLARLDPESTAYSIPLAARVKGPLDVIALERALGEIVRRHEALRTTFVEDGGEPVQLIEPFAGFVLPVDELFRGDVGEPERGSDAQTSESRVQQWLRQQTARPFDLIGAPLFRAALLRISPEEHVLVVAMHHIVGDGLSLGVLLHELRALYGAYRDRQPSPLPELSVQYADYAAWQRRRLQGERLDTLIAYWRAQLSGAQMLLELPADRARPAVQSHRGGRQRVDVSEDLAHALRALARREGATLYMVLLAACQVLLAKYSGQRDVIVGSPIAGRTRKELDGLIGCFVNTLALRTHVSDELSFRELLANVRQTALAAYDHQELPFERLVEALDVEHTLAYHPVFQAVVTLHQAAEAPSLPTLEVETIRVVRDTAKFDLEFAWQERGGELDAIVEYSADLFDAETIARLSAHLRTLLERIVADPAERLTRLSLLTSEERDELLYTRNRTGLELPSETAPVQFEQRVSLAPDAIAMTSDRGHLTYEALNARANRLARTLVEEGSGPEVVVGVLSTRNENYWVAALAIWKSGGALLPLDPAHPGPRQQQVLTQSGAAIVLVEDALAAALATTENTDGNPRVLSLESALTRAQDESNLGVRVEDRHLAYVIFTSGSTGTPKGAMIEHGGLRNHLWSKILDLDIDANDCVAQNASQSFDISIWQFLSVLLRSGRVDVLEDAVALAPDRLVHALDRHGLTIVQTVPSLMQLWVEALRRERPRLARLRWLIPNGEVLPPALCRNWFELYPHVPLINAYGLTETSDDVLHQRVSEAPGVDVTQIGLGARPLPNARLYVLDEHLEPTPGGVAGQLYIGGIPVGRGYVGQRALTAGRFVPDPFAEQPGQRLYWTGDRVRWGKTGELEFLGRVDHQVKLRGLRIEIGEIEAVLRQHPGVREVIVLVRDDARAGGRLVAYVTGASHLTEEELRGHVRQRAPEYMVPNAIVLLDEMPLNQNGKLDRHALPAPEDAADLEYVAPRHPTEELVAGIWADVLPVERVGVHDNFFTLGGHSLVATRVVSRVRDVFELELPLRALFEHPTVAQLSAVIEARMLDELVPGLDGITG